MLQSSSIPQEMHFGRSRASSEIVPAPPWVQNFVTPLWTGYEPALLVLSFSPILDVAASFQRAVAAAALSACVDVAASLLPTVAAAATSALLTSQRHNVSAASAMYQLSLKDELVGRCEGVTKPIPTTSFFFVWSVSKHPARLFVPLQFF